MNARVIAATVIFVSLLATIIFLVRFGAPLEAILPVSTLLGAAGAAFVPWLTGRGGDSSKGGGAAAVILATVAGAVGNSGCAALSGAATPQNVENAAAVAQYEEMLSYCRAKGKDAGSYAAYETCAESVDHDLCAQYKLRCATDGGAQ